MRGKAFTSAFALPQLIVFGYSAGFGMVAAGLAAGALAAIIYGEALAFYTMA